MRTPQSIAAVARQVLAIVGIVMGVLTQSVTSMHLPIAVSSVLTVGGAVILAVEHYVSDPSTGVPAVPVAPAAPTAAAPAPPAPATVPAPPAAVAH